MCVPYPYHIHTYIWKLERASEVRSLYRFRKSPLKYFAVLCRPHGTKVFTESLHARAELVFDWVIIAAFTMTHRSPTGGGGSLPLGGTVALGLGNMFDDDEGTPEPIPGEVPETPAPESEPQPPTQSPLTGRPGVGTETEMKTPRSERFVPSSPVVRVPSSPLAQVIRVQPVLHGVEGRRTPQQVISALQSAHGIRQEGSAPCSAERE